MTRPYSFWPRRGGRPTPAATEAGSATKLDKIKNLHVLSVGVHLERLGGGGVVDHYNSVYGKAYPRWIRA